MNHESASKHVTGEAVYIDDILVNEMLLVGRVVYSPHPRAQIVSFDLSDAKKVAGVHAVLSHRDIRGKNQMGPVVRDEPCLAADEVICIGQGVFLIAAETDAQCREAEKKIKIEYRPLEAILTIEKAIEKNSLLGPPRNMRRGDPDAALLSSPHVIKGELRTGAQEHWYLETQICLAVPGEGNEISLYSSSQHPSETQTLAAEVLGVNRNEVVVEVRRMGGAFGGKETQGNHAACWSALLCQATRRPVKVRLFRDDDQKITGKRHRFLSRYEAGFDDNGVLTALKLELNSDGGCATDLSFAILERAMLHSDNCYYVPNISILASVWKTNLPSNTAFRGFGGPQGMAVIETVVDRIARFLKKDSAEIRYKNFYGLDSRNVTHYGQTVENNRLYLLYDQLSKSSEYVQRRAAVREFNSKNEFVKRGLAMTPVKFGIAFTTSHLNQAGALVNIYGDGTILVNHGGTEMGQGLHTKIQQIAAAEFGVSPDTVKVNATNTSKVPNTAATAASAGADLNGMAVKNAVEKLKARLAAEIALLFTENNPGSPSRAEAILFSNNIISDSEHPDRKLPFSEAARAMFFRQVSLSATGYYKTPGIGWDRAKGWGRPFNYYAFGMCVSEVEIDVLTGGHTLLRADILHDVGDSLNPLIDIGQIEGGYIQGLGWCTTEEMKWDEKGSVLTYSPDTYKIPSVQDIPKDFRVELLQGAPNPNAIRKSKAVAEPPLMLSFSVWLAIKDAISAVSHYELEPEFSLPATNEVILLSIEQLKASMRVNKRTEVLA